MLRMTSRSDASDTDKPYSRTPVSGSERREAVEQTCSKAGSSTAGKSRRKSSGGGEETSSGSVGADVVQAVQGGMVGDCGPHTECDGNAVYLPVLPEIASGSRTGTRI